MNSFIKERYDYWINDIADPRVKEWVTVTSPAVPLTVLGIYIALIYKVVPAYMKNRKPYELKTFLHIYNVFQIISCLFLIYGVATSGWLTHYSWSCQPVDYTNSKDAIRMLNFVYYTHVLKGVELLETILFILRKKFNQVSKLHVYHHISTFLVTWIGVKYVGGGMATFPILINSIIHVAMYTYYLLASFGDEWQQRLITWKSKLTMFQMIQFCILIAHSLQSLHPECEVPKQLLLLYVPNLLLVLYMFYEFYKKNYTKDKSV